MQQVEQKYNSHDDMCDRIVALRENTRCKTFRVIKTIFKRNKRSEMNDLFTWATTYCKDKPEEDKDVEKILAAFNCTLSDLVPTKRPTKTGSSTKRKYVAPPTLSKRAGKRKKTLEREAEALENAKPKEMATEEEFLRGDFPIGVEVDAETQMSKEKYPQKICRVTGCTKKARSAMIYQGVFQKVPLVCCEAHYTQIGKFREKQSLEPFLVEPEFEDDMNIYYDKYGL